MGKSLHKNSHSIMFSFKMIPAFLFVLLMGVFVNKTAAQDDDYELVWSDEFDGTELDTSKWECQIGNGSGGWGNNEKEYYRAENAVVEDGFLTIAAKEESYNGYDYTSARIRTMNKGDWKYGKFEMRAKLPQGQGIWPAFWMMPTDNVYGGWAASGEIDIMEYLGHDTNTVYGTIHYGGSWPNNASSGTYYSISEGGFNDDFHVYTLIWEEGQIQWLVDGEVYQTQTSWYTSGHTFPAPFDQRFHIILNEAVGGNWPGYPDTTTQFPQNFIIDYVRVYQKSATGVEEGESELPKGIQLNQNHPNPFNSQTIIQYTLAEEGEINLSLYDMLGRKVDVLIDEKQNSGSHAVAYDAEGLSSGAYIYCLTAGNQSLSRKLILIK